MPEICSVVVPVAPVRKNAADASEMVTQLLYGETCEVLAADKQWRHVQGTFDGYRGWVDAKQLVPAPAEAVGVPAWVASLYLHAENITTGAQLLLPAGAGIRLEENDKHVLLHQGEPFVIRVGKWSCEGEKLSVDEMLRLARKFENAPYLWGGKTALGIDCSGYTQVLYKLARVPLQRDASQQVGQGTAVNTLSAVKPGDLAFFGKSPDKITHVGILMDAETIIHASGKVRVDGITPNGIVHAQTGTLTHKLTALRRLV